jgi:hypothetical protein
MDGTVQVEVLQRHSHYIGTLVTQLTGKLTQLAQGLSAVQGPPAAESAKLSEECAALARTLSAESDFLWRRLHFFVADTQPRPDAP